jgi:hypothetical protein
MFKDENRPHGLYGEVYDRSTGAKSRRSTQPFQKMTNWEAEVARIALEELNKKLGL